MKKITLVVACLGLIVLSSCAKDRTCTCTETDPDGDVEVYTYTYTEISGRDAKDACSNSSRTETQGSDSEKWSTECKLD
jgi:hypothetical protein